MSAVFGREPSRPLPDQEDGPIEAEVVEERGPDDEPLIGPISEEALQAEANADRGGTRL